MDQDKILDHLIRLLYIIRNVACHRALSKYKSDFKQNYWILIFNNFLDISILEWCKIFGSKIEPTHWRSLVDNHDSFRLGLLKALDIDNSNWDDYWRRVKNYRDKFVAHHENSPGITHYPELDNIIKSSFYYYSYLIEKLREIGIYYEPDDLSDYYEHFLRQASKFADMSYQVTKDIEEKVY
ncbi:MAG: hypothetical protein FJ126_04225 [Deltaproteobacteria bacterium]|nr:hypothetical protein [Deltaproteobacteria bacterium]MBM4294096.1 hypothetical protein [Deltaproteobacteria bacterium]